MESKLLGCNAFEIVKLSQLSEVDEKLFRLAWEDYRGSFVKQFVEANLAEISKLWKERRGVGIYGIIRVTANSPSDIVAMKRA
jgi:hypothetical protein